MKFLCRINFLIICLTVSLLFSACSKNDIWSSEDKASYIHYRNSQEANKKTTKILNKGDAYRQVSQDDLSMMREYMRTALSEAKMVNDTFLDKVHPEFQKLYRQEYQKSLELRIINLEEMNVSAEIEGQSLYNTWVDWFNSHKRELQFP